MPNLFQRSARKYLDNARYTPTSSRRESYKSEELVLVALVAPIAGMAKASYGIGELVYSGALGIKSAVQHDHNNKAGKHFKKGGIRIGEGFVEIIGGLPVCIGAAVYTGGKACIKKIHDSDIVEVDDIDSQSTQDSVDSHSTSLREGYLFASSSSRLPQEEKHTVLSLSGGLLSSPDESVNSNKWREKVNKKIGIDAQDIVIIEAVVDSYVDEIGQYQDVAECLIPKICSVGRIVDLVVQADMQKMHLESLMDAFVNEGFDKADIDQSKVENLINKEAHQHLVDTINNKMLSAIRECSQKSGNKLSEFEQLQSVEKIVSIIERGSFKVEYYDDNKEKKELSYALECDRKRIEGWVGFVISAEEIRTVSDISSLVRKEKSIAEKDREVVVEDLVSIHDLATRTSEEWRFRSCKTYTSEQLAQCVQKTALSLIRNQEVSAAMSL